MNEGLLDILELTGDCHITSYSYSNRTLSIAVILDGSGRQLNFSASTSFVFASLETPAPPEETVCFVQLVDLTKELNQNEHGIYVPPATFGNLMQNIKDTYHLAYGQRASEAPFMLRFMGNSPRLSCLLSSIDHVAWSWDAD